MTPGYLDGRGCNCRDGFCGADDCVTCRGASALAYRRRIVHEEHEDPDIPEDECAECRELELSREER